MKSTHRPLSAVFGVMLVAPLMLALTGLAQQDKGTQPSKQELPPGEGRDLLLKNCVGCHQLTVITSQHKSESKWTDTIVEMRNRGANGSDEDMEQVIHYLTANFGPDSVPAKVNINSAAAADMVAGLALSKADADAIVDYRTKNGKYKDLAALKQVPGVDAAKIDAAKDKIEF
jgi:competence ComEA-like helix-hairpin-helix protein